MSTNENTTLQRIIISKRNMIGVNGRRKSMECVNCEKCEERFENEMDMMQHHKFTHVDIDTFKCKECNYQTSNKHLLEKHI